MIKILLKSKILISVIIVSVIIIGTLFFYIPKITEENTIQTVTRNSKVLVDQIKLTRNYYANNVVDDIKKYAPNIKFDYNHQGTNGKLPFPTSTIHDLSKIFSENTGVEFQFYSKYPFKPKKDRVLTPSQLETLDYVEKNKNGMWVKRDTIGTKEVLRVAIADYMTDQACITCHNSHIDRTWEKGHWKLGDKRGVLEVITPLEEELLANKIMRNKILTLIGISLFLLVVYYSIMLIKREKKLLDENNMLDDKVKEEIEKNINKQNLLISQNRTAAMGEMMNAIIHQWKQPLNSISLSNSSIDMHIDIDDFDKKLLSFQTKNIKEQVLYMDNTLGAFRNFFKIQPRARFKVEDSVDEVLKLIGKLYRVENVEIKTSYDNSSYINGYPNEFNQVLINIFNNARDKILNKESIINKVFVKTFSSKKYVIITITDYAGEIPLDIIDTIFDPYVTTKDQGTGIGLNMSKNIIEKIGGTIKARNIKTDIDGVFYNGAQFIIKIPKV